MHASSFSATQHQYVGGREAAQARGQEGDHGAGQGQRHPDEDSLGAGDRDRLHDGVESRVRPGHPGVVPRTCVRARCVPVRPTLPGGR